jgi:UDP-glucose 4-epimerase
VPVLEPLVDAARALGANLVGPWPFDVSFMRHSCVVDTRRAKDELGWTPVHGAAETLLARRDHGKTPDDRATSEVALRAFLSRSSR